MKGGITEANRWDEQSRVLIPHLCVSDCRSLVDYVNSDVPAKTQDKRLGIELASIRQSVWDEKNQRTWNGQGGDKIEWTASGLPDKIHEANLPTQDSERELDWFATGKMREGRSDYFSTCCTR